MEDQRTNPFLYAKYYSQLPVSGVRFLAQRDLPDIIKTFVNGNKTLDYGCGSGQSTRFLKTLGLDVKGVDINEHMITVSKELDYNGIYETINSGELLSENEYYDLVYAGYVLLHISSKSEMLKVVNEIARVLKKDGTFIFVVANENAYKHPWLEENTDFEENRNPVSGSVVITQVSNNLKLYHYYWRNEDYHEVIEAAGLKIVYTHSSLGRESDGFPWVSETRVSYGTIYVAQKMHNLENA